MTTEEDTIFWKKKDDNDVDSSDVDTWDDTELIKAYDKAVIELKELKEEGNQSVPSVNEPIEVKGTKQKKKKKRTKNANKKWKVGGQCLAIFGGDGLYYEATILSTNYNEKTVYVKFSYYGNEEDVSMTNLLPMERKAELKVVPESVSHLNDYEQQSSDEDTHTTDHNKSKTQNNWRVSDICYVSNKNGVYQQAVINSFKSSDACQVTIIKSNKKREVKISQLHSSIPREQKKSRKESRSRYSSDMNGFHSDLPMFIPPPPPPMPLSNSGLPLSNPGLPNPPPFMSKFFPWQNNHNNSYKNNMSSNMSSNIPKCPQLPVIPDEVISGDEEALANMLMSWYISGFHTGYYQGTRKHSQNNHYLEVNGHRDEGRKSGSRWDKTLV